MSENLYIELQSIIYQSDDFRNFIITTHPFWYLFCQTMAWISPIFIGFFIRQKCLAFLIGICCFTSLIYLKNTSYCFVLVNFCNTEDRAISVYYDIVIGALYSIIVLLLVRTVMFLVQRIKQR
jgi:hypothetical protein